MKPSEALHKHREAVLRIARAVGANNVRVFGSVLRREDEDGSDLDLLVDMPRGTTLLDMARLEAARHFGITRLPAENQGDYRRAGRLRFVTERIHLTTFDSA